MNARYRLPDEFKTNRYHLRRVNLSDAQATFDGYAADGDVTRFLSWKPHPSVDNAIAFLKIATSDWNSGKGFPLVAFDRRQPTEFLGMFHPHLLGHRVNYGYVLRASAWGKGCASEVMSWLVDHAISNPSIYRTEAFCDVEHPASARVMEKVGMFREGTLRSDFRHPNISDIPRDCFIYSKVH